jgi:excisionase family DNA binding protein
MRLGIHEQSVRRKIAAGEIPYLQLGGPGCSLRILEDELERWLYRSSPNPGNGPAERRGSPALPVSGGQSSPQAPSGEAA